ncbi:MAG: cob(I)yrinic acid a,c-diamide adenosyltransferase [Anaerolineae bacterium]|nr:cob(I)yrinic acid a,c-diamide adenosyltransferase [Anaerolineae bacterium]
MHKSIFYTGKGDTGYTERLSGKITVSKSSIAIDTLGDLDETSCAIGVARALVRGETLKEILLTTQHHLCALMSHVAAVAETRQHFPGVSQTEVYWLEETMTNLEENIPPLQNFVLPGDSQVEAACHLARAVARRAERRLVALAEVESEITPPNLVYMNRLSSLLFIIGLHTHEFPEEAHSPAKD